MKIPVEVESIKRIRGKEIKSRKNTLRHRIPTNSRNYISVGQKFYLSTLGMESNSYVYECMIIIRV